MIISIETLKMAGYAYLITVLCVAAALMFLRGATGAGAINKWDQSEWLAFIFVCLFPVLLLIPLLSSILEFMAKERSLKEDLKSFIKNIKDIWFEILYNVDTYVFEQEKFLCIKILTDRYAIPDESFLKNDNNIFYLNVRAQGNKIFGNGIDDKHDKYNLAFIFHRNKIYVVENLDIVLSELQIYYKNINSLSIGKLVSILKNNNSIYEELDINKYTLIGFLSYKKLFLFHKKTKN